MNDLIRPALYDAKHGISSVLPPRNENTLPSEVVGPICETGDIFARQIELPELFENDLLYFKSAGAYGAVMSSTYNSRPLIPEILVDNVKFTIIRPRPSYDDLLGLDQIPVDQDKFE